MPVATAGPDSARKGPYASALLAQFGAEVIKIEPPKVGDPLRKWRKLHDGTSLWWYTQSRNKKSVTLDLGGRGARHHPSACQGRGHRHRELPGPQELQAARAGAGRVAELWMAGERAPP